MTYHNFKSLVAIVHLRKEVDVLPPSVHILETEVAASRNHLVCIGYMGNQLHREKMLQMEEKS